MNHFLAAAVALVMAVPAALAPAAASTTPTLSHEQLVWSYTLEWCESRGKMDAVNPKDRDGTPSWYSFQFKKDTFADLSEKYGITGDISDYVAQRAIVEHMILDASITPKMWRDQFFPDCVKKYGIPPRS